MKKDNKSYCAECTHFNDDTRFCTHTDGKLRQMELSIELAEAHHDCPMFKERWYRLTPVAILLSALKDNGMRCSWIKVERIFEAFIERMIQSGYIEIETEDENG